jgi:hypothetical protein
LPVSFIGTIFNVFWRAVNDEIYAIYEKEFKNHGGNAFNGCHIL